jgi:flagellar biosynthesis/type III secretory pathway M-ring protein FliF/YscJ
MLDKKQKTFLSYVLDWLWLILYILFISSIIIYSYFTRVVPQMEEVRLRQENIANPAQHPTDEPKTQDKKTKSEENKR